MYTKWQSIKYTVYRNVLINNFQESVLLTFGKRKYTNQKRYGTIFVTKKIIVLKK